MVKGWGSILERSGSLVNEPFRTLQDPTETYAYKTWRTLQDPTEPYKVKRIGNRRTKTALN